MRVLGECGENVRMTCWLTWRDIHIDSRAERTRSVEDSMPSSRVETYYEVHSLEVVDLSTQMYFTFFQ